ncbi:MAG: hypothetical protein ACRBB0_05155 [Pelagimonas sp.]|uniref:hypothetical protein n=1 Tax=Pelagimonas sp. TaxID=2073170 RepID=UPI003D6BF19B
MTDHSELIERVNRGDMISPEVMRDTVRKLAADNERFRKLLNGNGWSDEDLDKDAEIERLRGALKPFDWALISARERLGRMPDKNDVTALALRFVSHDHLKAARAALEGKSND